MMYSIFYGARQGAKGTATSAARNADARRHEPTARVTGRHARSEPRSPGRRAKPLPDDGLSIGELSRRTGVGVSTLRAWERRHGFPVAQRLVSGHRRYVNSDVDAVLAVVAERRSGGSVRLALERARLAAGASHSSMVATVRRALPDVAPAVLSKSTMLAISRAIEDEVAARADRPVLVAAFQDARFWHQSERRWRDLSLTASAAIAFMVGSKAATQGRLWQVPLDPAAPLSREWAVVCDSPTLSACLVAVERPGSRGGPSRQRVFEALWTVEPMVVREAARAAWAVALETTGATSAPPAGEAAAPGRQDPGAAALVTAVQSRLQHPAVATSHTVRAATALTNRIMAYLDQRRG